MSDSPIENVELLDEVISVCVFNNCTEQHTSECRKCKRQFCIMHANRFSPNFCMDCFKNLAFIEEKFTRTFEDFDTKADKLIVSKQSCTKYYMDGPDWLFLTAWIDKLSDSELRAIWNFHFFVMKTIEAENETRKIREASRQREAKADKINGKVITTTTKTSSGIVKVTKPVDTAEDIRKKLERQGLPTAMIDAMIATMATISQTVKP